jgi:hypothetical protein
MVAVATRSGILRVRVATVLVDPFFVGWERLWRTSRQRQSDFRHPRAGLVRLSEVFGVTRHFIVGFEWCNASDLILAADSQAMTRAESDRMTNAIDFIEDDESTSWKTRAASTEDASSRGNDD